MACRRTDNANTLSLFPGWMCCACRTYNGFQRRTCKACPHPACYFSYKGERLPFVNESKDGHRFTDYCDPAPTARDKNRPTQRLEPTDLGDN